MATIRHHWWLSNNINQSTGGVIAVGYIAGSSVSYGWLSSSISGGVYKGLIVGQTVPLVSTTTTTTTTPMILIHCG